MPTSTRLRYGALLAGICAAAGYGIAFQWALLPVVVSVPLVLVVLYAGRDVFAPWLLSPARLFALTYLAMGLLGGMLFPIVAEEPGGASIRLSLTGASVFPTIELFVLFALAAACGALIAGRLRRSRHPTGLPKSREEETTDVGGAARPPAPALVWVLIGLALLAAVCTCLGYGPGNLIERDIYLDQHPPNRGLASIGAWLAVPSMIALAYVAHASYVRIYRNIAVALLVFHTAIFFALGTRRLAAVPILIALGWAVGSPTRKASARLLAVGLIASLLALQLPLSLRSETSHGFVPYVNALAGNGTGAEITGASVILNFVISFPIAQEVAFNLYPLPKADLFESINPLPGGMTNWYEVAPNHRLNPTTPFSLIGELGNYGIAALVCYALIAGAVLGYADCRIRELLAAGRQLWAVALLGTGLLFIVMSLQYDTRTASRLLYYLIAVDVVLRVYDYARRHQKRPARLRGPLALPGGPPLSPRSRSRLG